jgi:hypothetical protein
MWNGGTNIVRVGSIPKSASGLVVFALLFYVGLVLCSDLVVSTTEASLHQWLHLHRSLGLHVRLLIHR